MSEKDVRPENHKIRFLPFEARARALTHHSFKSMGEQMIWKINARIVEHHKSTSNCKNNEMRLNVSYVVQAMLLAPDDKFFAEWIDTWRGG